MVRANADAAASSEAKPRKPLPKDKQLALIKSLQPEKDDERAAISKKISWILRHGAKMAGVAQDEQKWVLTSDLCKATILEGITEDVLMQVIVDSNGKKLRYELKDTDEGQMIRAYAKEERKAKETAAGVSLEVSKDKKGGGSLRGDAQVFVPGACAAAAAPPVAAPYPVAPASPMGYYPPWGGFFPPMMPTPYMPPFWPPMISSGKFSGRIKSYNHEKGYGFIECEQTKATYNRDVFLHKAHIGDLTEGTWVTFVCEVNKQGMPQAKDVAALVYPGMQPMVPTTPVAGKGGKGKGKDSGKGTKGGKEGKGGKGGKAGAEGKAKGKGRKGKDDKESKEPKEGEAESGSKEKQAGEQVAEPAAAEPAAEAAAPAEKPAA